MKSDETIHKSVLEMKTVGNECLELLPVSTTVQSQSRSHTPHLNARDSDGRVSSGHKLNARPR